VGDEGVEPGGGESEDREEGGGERDDVSDAAGDFGIVREALRGDGWGSRSLLAAVAVAWEGGRCVRCVRVG
jgi:hypothetical protein